MLCIRIQSHRPTLATSHYKGSIPIIHYERTGTEHKQIELQARSQRATLLEEELSEALTPGQSIDHIVQHAVTELDTHM